MAQHQYGPAGIAGRKAPRGRGQGHSVIRYPGVIIQKSGVLTMMWVVRLRDPPGGGRTTLPPRADRRTEIVSAQAPVQTGSRPISGAQRCWDPPLRIRGGHARHLRASLSAKISIASPALHGLRFCG